MRPNLVAVPVSFGNVMAGRCRLGPAPQLHRDLTEQRRGSVVPVILHVANTTAVRAPSPDGMLE